MNKLILAAGALFLTALATSSAQASHGCCTPCNVTWVERTVTCYRPEWQEREVSCTVMRPIPHEVVEKRTCTVMVPVWNDQKCVVHSCRYVPREVEQEVTRCRMVPVSCTDPCTGCTYTTCRPEYTTERVKCTVMDRVVEPKEIVVKVCSFKPEERTFEYRRIVCDYKRETVTYMQRHCVMVPYEAKVMVPVCCP